MERYSDAVLDPNGNAIRGATITVTAENGAVATIYSVDGATTQANPMTSGADGEYFFYAANGRYTLTIEATGFTTDTKEVLLYDADDAVAVPVATSAWRDKECYPISAGVTLNTSDMAAGKAFSLANDTGSDLTITQGSGVTLRKAGTASTGNVTLAAYGVVTIWCRSGTVAYAMGAGVS